MCSKFFLPQTWREKVSENAKLVGCSWDREGGSRRKWRHFLEVGGEAETAWESRRKDGDRVSNSKKRRRRVLKCVERWSQREEVGETAERECDNRSKSIQRSCSVTEARREAVTVRGHTCDSDDSGGDRIQWKRVDGNDNQPTGSRSATLF